MFESINIDNQDEDLPSGEETEFIENENSVEKEQIARVDIMEQLEEFSEQKKELILQNTMVIQLTEGCGGGCPFCARHIKGEKRNIRAHYDYKSLKDFVEKYESLLRKSIPLYSKSDPLDWEDKDENGEYGIVDIYKLFKRPPQICTSIPPGSEQRFVDLCMYLAQKNIPVLNEIQIPNLDDIELGDDDDDDEHDFDHFKNGSIRISEGNHNKQRIKQVMKKLDYELADKGYSDEEIERFYLYCISIEERNDEELYQAGMLIENHNDISGVADTIAFSDRVCFSPGGIRSEIVTAPTKYEPTAMYNGLKKLDTNLAENRWKDMIKYDQENAPGKSASCACRH